MTRSKLILLAGLLLIPFLSSAKDDAKHTRIRVKNVHRIFENGEHNAFTDLIRWNGKFWVTFRSSPNGHQINSKSAVIVLSSPDGKEWIEAHRFSLSGWDTRDPHFLAFNGKLSVLAGAIYVDAGKDHKDQSISKKTYGCTVSTKDGKIWSEPAKMPGTEGYFVWCASAHKGKAYLSGRRTKRIPPADGKGKPKPVGETTLFESTDGSTWKVTSVYQDDRGDETSFLFEPNGDFIAVTRRGGPHPVQMVRGKPPYQKWEHKDFGFFMGGPMIKKWGDRYIVGGRRNFKKGKKTGLYWLIGNELKSIAILPSGGDNSYPGFAQINDK
ncbi:MAG: hypothetical protein KAG66_14325, partial [Methylococcales bacterium]|nr:hypothetical protein [Methylococcales bacterium]